MASSAWLLNLIQRHPLSIFSGGWGKIIVEIQRQKTTVPYILLEEGVITCTEINKCWVILRGRECYNYFKKSNGMIQTDFFAWIIELE